MPEPNGVFKVAAFSGEKLPCPQQIHFSSAGDIVLLKQTLQKHMGELEQYLQDNNIECAAERRGDDIASLTIEGHWVKRPFASGDSGSIAADKQAWRQNFKAKAMKLKSAVGNQLHELGLYPKSLRLLRRNMIAAKKCCCCPAVMDANQKITFLEPPLLAGYGDQQKDGALRRFPLSRSFVGWLTNNGLETMPAGSLLAFKNYPGVANDIAMLYGLMGPEQRIAVKSANSLAILNQWGSKSRAPGGYIVYGDPPADWQASLENIAAAVPWPRISVVIPSFNQADFVRQALDSIFSQNYPNLETIVLDPGSTDGTREILQEYANKISRLILEPDNGQSDALQRGLNMASGDLLTWLCTDDLLEPGALFQAAWAHRRFKADVIVGGCRRIDENNQELGRHFSAMPFLETVKLDAAGMIDVLHGWLAGHFFYQPEVFFTREIWQRSGAFFHPSSYYCMDYDLWVRMALAGATGVQLFHYFAASRAQQSQKTQLDGPPVQFWQQLNYLKHYLNIIATAFDCQ